jgi:hypothetical protein
VKVRPPWAWGTAVKRLQLSRLTGLTDAVTRILAEQFVTFPRFVITGAWIAAFRNAVS